MCNKSFLCWTLQRLLHTCCATVLLLCVSCYCVMRLITKSSDACLICPWIFFQCWSSMICAYTLFMYIYMYTGCPMNIHLQTKFFKTGEWEVGKVLNMNRNREFCSVWLALVEANMVTVKIRAFWDIALCSLGVDRRFRGAYCLHHQGALFMCATIVTSLHEIVTFNLLCGQY
jgi:hypothetical protein